MYRVTVRMTGNGHTIRSFYCDELPTQVEQEHHLEYYTCACYIDICTVDDPLVTAAHFWQEVEADLEPMTQGEIEF